MQAECNVSIPHVMQTLRYGGLSPPACSPLVSVMACVTWFDSTYVDVDVDPTQQVEVELPSGGADSDGADVDELDSDVDCMEGLDGEVRSTHTCDCRESWCAC